MTDLSRRGLLTGFGTLFVAAPAIVRASSIMAVKSFVPDPAPIIVGGAAISYDFVRAVYFEYGKRVPFPTLLVHDPRGIITGIGLRA